ncbi:hypothetical protein [Flexithrix dorotheae]|uniref:hypothetical protein n=1 Tax=Flexithrix dorotheae TaxID=70993 RepID=UPI0003797D32|nr:hypothetical protein [Flexithrix dorotheae]
MANRLTKWEKEEIAAWFRKLDRFIETKKLQLNLTNLYLPEKSIPWASLSSAKRSMTSFSKPKKLRIEVEQDLANFH